MMWRLSGWRSELGRGRSEVAQALRGPVCAGLLNWLLALLIALGLSAIPVWLDDVLAQSVTAAPAQA